MHKQIPLQDLPTHRLEEIELSGMGNGERLRQVYGLQLDVINLR
jgi:hypothetical protein